jgi:hypothetical protein
MPSQQAKAPGLLYERSPVNGLGTQGRAAFHLSNLKWMAAQKIRRASVVPARYAAPLEGAALKELVPLKSCLAFAAIRNDELVTLSGCGNLLAV